MAEVDTPSLMDEHSLMDHMRGGAFGTFRQAVEPLGRADWSGFTFPKVVVLGSESAGKSSLLENLMKCPVFPRNRNICTKAPVEFKMRMDKEKLVEVEFNGTRELMPDRNLIRAAIQRVFDKVEKGVRADKVVVRINGPAVPTLTLVDLPGLRTYPADLAEQTRTLAEDNLDPETLVICVVQATDRLTSNNAVALAMELLKEDMRTRAILVLTKPDLVAECDWEEKVVSRLNGTSPELGGVEFAAVVAVVNRPQQTDGTEKMELAEMHKWEADWWQKKLADLSPELLGQVGVQSLIAKVNAVFSEHIRLTWKPRADHMLADLRIEPQAELAALGPDPSTLTPQVVAADVCSRLHDIGNAWDFGLPRLPPVIAVEPGTNWDWAAEAAGVGKTTSEWSTGLLASPQLLPAIQAIIGAAFEDVSDLKTKRFGEMLDAFLRIAAEQFADRKPAAAEQLDRLVQDRLHHLWCEETPTREDLEGLERGVLRVVTAFVYSTVCATAAAANATDLSLAESPAVHDRRAALEVVLCQIDEARSIIAALQ
eukprot:EG_transcript_6599